jgi:nicotinamidase/pyrazinamidase
VGTAGQHKPAITMIEGGRQFILEKQKLDCFSSPHLVPLLERLNAERYVVYGVVTEICVRCAAFGLLRMGKRVEIVMDAVKSLDEQKAREMFSEFSAAGGRLTTSATVLEGV